MPETLEAPRIIIPGPGVEMPMGSAAEQNDVFAQGHMLAQKLGLGALSGEMITRPGTDTQGTVAEALIQCPAFLKMTQTVLKTLGPEATQSFVRTQVEKTAATAQPPADESAKAPVQEMPLMNLPPPKPRNTKATKQEKQDTPIETRPETAKPEAVDNGAVEEAIVRPVSPPPEAVSPPVKLEVPAPLRPPEEVVPEPVVNAEKSTPVRAEPPAPIIAAQTQAPQIEHPPEPAPAKIAVEAPAFEVEDTPAPLLAASENAMVITVATEADESAWPSQILEQPTQWMAEAAIEAPTAAGLTFTADEIPSAETSEPLYLPVEWVPSVNAESAAIDPVSAKEITLPLPQNLVVPPVYTRMAESLQTLMPEKAEAVQPVVESLVEVVAQIKELQFTVVQPEAQDAPMTMTVEHEQIPVMPAAVLAEAEQKLTELCEELFVLLGLPQDEAVLAQFKRFIVQADDLEPLLSMPTRYVADGEGTHEFLRWPLKIMRQFVQFVQDKLERLHASLGYAAVYSTAAA